MSFLIYLFRDLSDTSQVKTFPVFHSACGTSSSLVTATYPSASMLMSFFDVDLGWDSEDHLIWGSKPLPEHMSLCGPDSSLGARRSSTDGSARYYVNKGINDWMTESMTLPVSLNKKATGHNTSTGYDGRVTLTKNIASGVWLKAVGKALVHFAGETCVFIPVCSRDGEASTDWMEACGFRKINILFFRDVNSVGLKGDVQVMWGKFCNDTLQWSTVSFQQIWKRSPDLNRWSCICSSWIIQKKQSRFIHWGALLSWDVWFSCCI